MSTMDTSSPHPQPSLLFSVKQVAQQCGVSEKTIRRSIERGELRCRRFGRAVRIAHHDLCRFLDAR